MQGVHKADGKSSSNLRHRETHVEVFAERAKPAGEHGVSHQVKNHHFRLGSSSLRQPIALQAKTTGASGTLASSPVAAAYIDCEL